MLETVYIKLKWSWALKWALAIYNVFLTFTQSFADEWIVYVEMDDWEEETIEFYIWIPFNQDLVFGKNMNPPVLV
jgi:hypothetical protein